MNVVYGIQREKRKEKGPSLPGFSRVVAKNVLERKMKKNHQTVQLLQNNMKKIF